jgi:hypothetical protein
VVVLPFRGRTQLFHEVAGAGAALVQRRVALVVVLLLRQALGRHRLSGGRRPGRYLRSRGRRNRWHWARPVDAQRSELIGGELVPPVTRVRNSYAELRGHRLRLVVDRDLLAAPARH